MLLGLSPGAGPAGDCLLILLLALALDAALGDPDWLYRALPHPIALLGRLIGAGEKRLNSEADGRAMRIAIGGLFALAVVLGAAGLGYLLHLLLWQLFGGWPVGWAVEAVIASILLAGRSLQDHVAAVAEGLAHGLNRGRQAVARIVGRDPEALDRAGVSRAALESLAENFSDGVVAPAFWFALLGLPGIIGYKALNTLDSMIGHRDPRHEAFGKVAARLDDVANFLPARLAGLIYVGAAALLPGASAGRAWAAMLRDAPRHRSPNAGWQEAALAGALGFALAGPRKYKDGPVEDAWMGEGGRALLGPEDIREGLRLTRLAWALMAALILALWALVTL